MNTDPDVEKLFATFAELRRAAGDGPTTRKLLDALFRYVHSLKANASANGVDDLVAAAHEFENVLHSLRTGKIDDTSDALVSDGIPANIWTSLKQDEKHALRQSLAEGARLFHVQTSFDVADFDSKFQSLKEILSKTGEVISTSPKVENERPGKVNFQIVYAASDASPAISSIPDVTIAEIPAGPPGAASERTTDISALEQCLENLAAQMMNLPTTPVRNPVELVLRAGRAAARATCKEVDFEVRGEEILNDKTLPPTIADALIHLVRNAVDHGIESSEARVKLGKSARGKVVIEATRFERQTIITLTDDGRGIDPALIANGLLFRPGFTTATKVSETSGRGVGLDVVKDTVEQLGGSVRVTSNVGEGSRFEVMIPGGSNR